MLPDEVHRGPGLIAASGGRGAAGGFEKERHVVGKGPQGLHSLGVKGGLAGLAAVNDVPVLGGDDGHVHHLEGEVQGLEGGCGAAAPANRNGGRRLPGYSVTIGVEGPLDNGEQGSVGLAVIHGRAHDQGVARGEFLAYPVADVVVKDASAASFRRTLTAGDAAAHGLVANPNYFAVNSVFLKLRRHFRKCGGGIAFLARTSVDE